MKDRKGMTRREALALLAGASACACCGSASAARLSYDLAASEIAEGTWAVHGRAEYFSLENGGNIVNVAFVETPDGVVVIDSGPSRRYGQALFALIEKTIPNKPILRVYNTHHHPDHCFGNQAFDANLIAAPAQVIENIRTEGDALADNMYRLVGDWMRGTAPVLPTQALSEASEELGGRGFSLFYLSGHTSSDLVVRDDTTGVVFAGDLAFLHRAPTTPHASIEDWQNAIQSLAAIDRDLILPGHGPSDATGESLEQTADYLHWLDSTIREAVLRGLTMNEAMLIEIPKRFNSLDVVKSEFERSVVHLYLQLESQLMPVVPLK